MIPRQQAVLGSPAFPVILDAYRRHSARERIRTEHQEVRRSSETTSRWSSRRRRGGLIKTLKRNIIRDYLLKSKGIRYCPTRSGMNMQELKTDSADVALRELMRQTHSHRMELYHTNHILFFFFGVRGFHARDWQKGPVRTIVKQMKKMEKWENEKMN